MALRLQRSHTPHCLGHFRLASSTWVLPKVNSRRSVSCPRLQLASSVCSNVILWVLFFTEPLAEHVARILLSFQISKAHSPFVSSCDSGIQDKKIRLQFCHKIELKLKVANTGSNIYQNSHMQSYQLQNILRVISQASVRYNSYYLLFKTSNLPSLL